MTYKKPDSALCEAFRAARRPRSSPEYIRPAAVALAVARRNLSAMPEAQAAYDAACEALAAAIKIDGRRYAPAKMAAESKVTEARRNLTALRLAVNYARPWRDCGAAMGQAFKIGNGQTLGYWCESAATWFRRVGFADEIDGAQIDHRGWYLEHEGDSSNVARGAVYLLTGHKGVTRAIPAVELPSNGDSGAILALGDIVEDSESGAWETAEAICQAARQADSLAESYAEAERDYRAAWNAGARYAEAGQEAAEARREFLAVRTAAREAAQGGQARPILCKAIRAHLESLAETWAELKAERKALAEGNGRDDWRLSWWPGDKAQAAAFADGAESV